MQNNFFPQGKMLPSEYSYLGKHEAQFPSALISASRACHANASWGIPGISDMDFFFFPHFWLSSKEKAQLDGLRETEVDSVLGSGSARPFACLLRHTSSGVEQCCEQSARKGQACIIQGWAESLHSSLQLLWFQFSLWLFFWLHSNRISWFWEGWNMFCMCASN